MKTGLVTSDTFQNHDTGPGHPEQIARISVINEKFSLVPLVLAGGGIITLNILTYGLITHL